jgi:hypothetical protein
LERKRGIRQEAWVAADPARCVGLAEGQEPEGAYRALNSFDRAEGMNF